MRLILDVFKRRWAKKLLVVGTWPRSGGNIEALVAWQRCEGTTAKYNPLATTKKMVGSLPLGGNPDQNNGNPVQEYPTKAVGLEATRLTLILPYYVDIVRHLKAGDLDQDILHDTKVAAQLATWGTGASCPKSLLASRA